jgi:Ca2+-binding EF-hand superfamily protein
MMSTTRLLPFAFALLATTLAVGQEEGPTPEEQAKRDAELAQLEARYFALCDLDQNGWISFSEARTTLGLERARFRVFDADRDGRLERPEFGLRYREFLGRLGAFDAATEKVSPPPVVQPEPDVAPAPRGPRFPQAERLLVTYDVDKSGGLGARELTTMFTEQQLRISLQVVLSQLDPNETGELELFELVPLASMIETQLIVPLDELPAERRQRIEDIMRDVRPREMASLGATLAPQLSGPMTHFRRLDLNGDGLIEADDLKGLASPARIDVRASAVLAALDRDGDGALSPTEFRAALGD